MPQATLREKLRSGYGLFTGVNCPLVLVLLLVLENTAGTKEKRLNDDEGEDEDEKGIGG